MKIFSEQSLRHFDFWGGAQENANELSWEQFDDYLINDDGEIIQQTIVGHVA